MDPATQAVLFALLGAVLGGAAVLAWRVSEIQQQRAEEAEEPVLPDGVAGVLAVLRSSALVVDRDDTVLKATAPVYGMGVVSGEHWSTTRSSTWSVRYDATGRSARPSCSTRAGSAYRLAT